MKHFPSRVAVFQMLSLMTVLVACHGAEEPPRPSKVDGPSSPDSGTKQSDSGTDAGAATAPSGAGDSLGAGKGDAGKSDAGKSDAAKDNAGKEDVTRDDAGKTDAAISSPGESDAGKPANGGPQIDPSKLKTDYQAFEARLAKLRACGVLDDGAYPFDPMLDQRCESLCMVAASCQDLKTEACDDTASPALEACFDKCNEDVVTCGDGTTVSSESVCNLEQDCSDGEDEKHCDDFACTSGASVGGLARCDGEMDCSDGSDEKGCALICGRPFATNLRRAPRR